MKEINMVVATKGVDNSGASYLETARGGEVAEAGWENMVDAARNLGKAGEVIRSRGLTEDEEGVPRQFRECIAGLPDETLVKFAQGSKEEGSSAAIRHAKYLEK